MENFAVIATFLHTSQHRSAADWVLDHCPDDLLWTLERSWLSEVPRDLLPGLTARLGDPEITEQRALTICRMIGSAAALEDQVVVEEFLSATTSEEKDAFLSELRDETLKQRDLDTQEDAVELEGAELEKAD